MDAMQKQYATSANLAARIALHQRCSLNSYGLQRWIFDRLALRDGQRVLEIACGTGSLWRENADRVRHIELTLTDISVGMIETTRAVMPRARFAACALPQLPFSDASFDVVIANHMLYHVEDRELGLRDVQRVLREGGTFFAATNGVDHLREIKDLMLAFGIAGGDVSSSFTLENAPAQLARVFDDVHLEEYEDGLRVDDPQLLIDYIASMNAQAAQTVAARGEEIRRAIQERIARDGAYTIRKSTGLFAMGGR